MKYEFMVHIWGGFFNPEHKSIHKKEPGYYWFGSSEERAKFINDLDLISIELNAHVLMRELCEGFETRYRTIAKMTLEMRGEKYNVGYDFGFAYPEEAAHYMFVDGNFGCDCVLSKCIIASLSKRSLESIYLPCPLSCGDSIQIEEFEVVKSFDARSNYSPQALREEFDIEKGL